jgi:hypothetical protein
MAGKTGWSRRCWPHARGNDVGQNKIKELSIVTVLGRGGEKLEIYRVNDFWRWGRVLPLSGPSYLLRVDGDWGGRCENVSCQPAVEKFS